MLKVRGCQTKEIESNKHLVMPSFIFTEHTTVADRNMYNKLGIPLYLE